MQNGNFYPTLSHQDILDVMNQMEIPISEEDLEKPTPQRVVIWYESFLYLLKGVVLHPVTETNLDLSQITDYPDSHSDDISLMSFYQQMIQLMRQVGVEDFSLRDMLKPEPTRVRRILSGICNFAMFRDDRMPVLEKYTAQAEREYERLESLQKELAQVQQEISRIREQHEKDLPKVNSLTEEIGGMDRELKVLAGTQKVAKDTTERLRDEREILQGKVLEITEAVGALQDELKRLNARVVHSPEKLKQSIQSLSESITTARTQLVHRETESRQLSTKIEMLQELLNEIRACLQQMSDAEAIVHRHEDELRKLAAEKENVNQETSNLKNLGVREEQLKFQGQSAKDKIERLKANRQAKREQSEARIKRLEAEDKEVASKFGEMSAKMVERRGRYDELQEEIKNCKSTMDMDAVAIQECYEKLRQQTLEYQDNVILSLEELLTHFYE